MPETTPLIQTLAATTDAVGAGADATVEVGQAAFAGTITAVRYIPTATITGAATNNRTFTVTVRGQAGAGTTVAATLNMANAVNAAAHDEKAITLGVAANLVVAQGDTISFESTHIGTGIADPGGRVEVDITRS